MRADVYLFQKGYVKSRSRAGVLIEEGNVRIGGKLIMKCSEPIDEEKNLAVEINDTLPYVSRGGYKLEHALDVFNLDVTGLCALDVGASTGGFTDCLLQHGARRVYAVDAGEGQLDPKLGADPRVISREKYNARNIDGKDFPEPIDIVVMDVSFISQTLILPSLSRLMAEGSILVSLIKPQFEVGRSGVGKRGIVKSEKERGRAVCDVLGVADALGLGCTGLDRSAISGGDGNVEFVALFQKEKKRSIDDQTAMKTAEARKEGTTV